jgi:ProP effector
MQTKHSKFSNTNSLTKKPMAFKKKNDVPLTRHQKIKKTLNWLFKNYPKTFKRKYQKPLKIGIDQDLLTLKKPWIEKGILQAAIRKYVYSISYLSCLLSNVDRIDLSGKKCGVVEDIHKSFASTKITESLQKVKKIHNEQG